MVEKILFDEELRQFFREAHHVRRISKNDIELSCDRALQKSNRIRFYNFTLCLQSQGLDVPAKGHRKLFLLLHEGHELSSAGEAFNPQGPRTAKEVKDVGPFEVEARLQGRKNGGARFGRSRSYPADERKVQEPSSQSTADNLDLSLSQ